MSRTRVIGTMVACLSCKCVVWALDRDCGDLRAVANMLGLRCPLCGARGSFDGHNPTRILDGAHDGWSTMRKLAELERWEWQNGPSTIWREYVEPSS